MQLVLKTKTKKTTKTNEPYYELWFEYPDGSKKVRYWVWSFVHNDTNNLSHIWDTVEQAQLGDLYNLQFRKSIISNRMQFVITVLEDANKPISFVD